LIGREFPIIQRAKVIIVLFHRSICVGEIDKAIGLPFTDHHWSMYNYGIIPVGGGPIKYFNIL
jgi:hypothetical protein